MLKTNYSAFKTPDGKIVLIIINEADKRNIKLGALSDNMEIYTTDSEYKLEKTYSGAAQSKITVAKDSITTVVFA